MINSILFFGCKNCSYSDKLKKYLKKKSNSFFYIESEKIRATN